jgi:hypothetical protein
MLAYGEMTRDMLAREKLTYEKRSLRGTCRWHHRACAGGARALVQRADPWLRLTWLRFD